MQDYERCLCVLLYVVWTWYSGYIDVCYRVLFFSSRRLHPRCALVTGVQTCALPILLAGMLAAPNLGADYGRRFDGMYARLAAKHHVPLYPFFLDGVAANPQLVLGDGMHPNREGVAVIVTHILPQILGFLGQ